MGTWDPKRVGGPSRFAKPRLDGAERAVVGRRHFERKATPGHCTFCKQAWPCDAAQLYHDLEATEASFRRLTTMPF